MQIANGMTVLNALADEAAQRTKAHADSLQEVAQGIRKAILSICPVRCERARCERTRCERARCERTRAHADVARDMLRVSIGACGHPPHRCALR
jgi:hypothetical protein